ncbi:MAG TPA: hypothetical protein VJH04_00080 [archaeon]|nr:hypothetical protein [archaeon]
MTDEKRLHEMEKSIKAIAKFVKEQTDKMDSTMGGNDIEYVKDGMDELKRKIESFSDEKEFSRLQFKKLDKLEESLEERMNRIEDIARQKGDDKLKKTLQDTRAELDSLKRDLMSKMEFMDQKLEKMPEVHLEELTDSVGRLEREVKDLKMQKTGANDKYREELDRINSEVLGKFKSTVSQQEKTLNDIASRIDNFDPRGDMENLKKDIYSKFNRLQSNVSETMQHTDWKDEIDHKVGLIDKKLNESLVLKNHLDDMEKNLKEMRAISNRLKDFDADSYKKEFDTRMHNAFEQLHGIEAQDVKKLGQMAEQFRNIEAQDIKNVGDALESLKGIEAEDIRKLSESVKQFEGIELRKLSKFAEQVNNAEDLMEDESVNRISIEKKLHDIESKVENYEKYIHETFSQLKNLEAGDIKRMNAALEQTKGHELQEIKELAKQLVKERDEMEDEVVNRLSLERRVNEMEQKMKHLNETEKEVKELDIDRASMERHVQTIDSGLREMNDMMQKIKSLENVDISKVSNRLQDMESNMKMQTVKLLTQQLNEFAKSLERRLPNIVSREEYMRQIADINQRMRTIEAPDLSPLGARVGRLEKKIEEIAVMMRSMYNRVPIVVE